MIPQELVGYTNSMETTVRRPMLTLAVLRRTCRVSQKALAEALQCYQSDVSQWENEGRDLSLGRAELILSFFRASNRKAVRGIKAEDLTRPWDEVLIERVPSSRGS